MPAPASVPELFTLIRKSGLLDAAELDVYARAAAEQTRDPAKAAQALVQAGKLTSFQAKQLLEGKYKGMVLGPYRLLRLIGKGGMGTVFQAEHTGMRRSVAIKVLPQEMARHKAALERFYREARAAAALDDPNIVRAYDVGQAYGMHFLVMEYVDGRTLDKVLAGGGPLPCAQAVAYAAQAANGLMHAHAMGFVHRDIKPANLMVTRDGTVKILDMGLARSFLDEKDNLTALLDRNGLVGTADFIAPEQALNQAQDARTDVYSLGATLYALIAGRPPFDGTTAQKLLQHQLNAPPSLTAVAAGVPPELAAVVAKMMAKRPDDRYQTISEVLDAMSPWVPEELQPTAPSTGKLMRVSTAKLELAPVRSQPAWLVPAAVGGLLLLVLLAVWAVT